MSDYLGRMVSTRFSANTVSGNHRSWLNEPKSKLSSRPIRSTVDSSYLLIANVTAVSDLSLTGEIIGRVVKEFMTVLSPYTLTTLLRTGEEINHSNIERVDRGEAQVNLLNRAQVAFANWTNPDARGLIDLLRLEVGMMADRLDRATTTQRQNAAHRIVRYQKFLDTLGRPNPLIVGDQFRLAAICLALQTEIDANMSEAAQRRIEFGQDLWDRACSRLVDLVNLACEKPDGSLELFLPYLEDLQFKPFSFAVSYVLWRSRQRLVAPQLGEAIIQAFTAEMELALCDWTISDIKHHPEMVDQIDLTQLEHTLPLLNFDEPYRLLHQLIIEHLGEIITSFRAHKGENIEKLAEILQRCLRYRTGRLNLHGIRSPFEPPRSFLPEDHCWYQPHVFNGKLIETEPLSTRARGSRPTNA